MFHNIAFKRLSTKESSPFTVDPKLNSHGKINNILATSAAKSLYQREYCADSRPFAESLSRYNVSLQVGKAALLQTSLALIKYNDYLDKTLAAEEKNMNIEPYNWKAAWLDFYNGFSIKATRFLSISIISSFYQSKAVALLSPKLADRLTKDLSKSVVRKISKYPRFSACTRMIKTSLFSCIPLTLATFTVDILFNINDYIVEGKLKYTVKEMAIWFFKKIAFYSLCSGAAAVGYAVGSYVHPPYAIYFAGIFDSISSFGVAIALGM